MNTNEPNNDFVWKDYTKQYRQKHPEKALLWRLNSAAKLLRAHGYTVLAPEEHAKTAE